MDFPYEQYFEAMPCYLSVQDRDFKIVKANQRFCNDFGDYEGRHCYEVYKHRSEKCEACPVERTFRDGERHGSEEIVRALDGREVSVIVHTTPIRNEAGEITSVMEMSTDVTETKLLQKQVHDSRERYRSLFEEVPCYISIQDRDLRIIEANRRFREAFGECYGCKCYQRYKHRSEQCISCPVQRTFEDGQVHRSEEVVTALSGERINTLVYTAPIHNALGEIESVMEMSTNITPIRQLQSQLESTGLLISSISHGIKGMLTGLDGGIYMVKTAMEKDNPARLKKGWDMVQRNVQKIRNMVLNILYYAKERQPHYEIVEASELVDEVIEVVQPKADRNAIKLKFALAPEAGDFEVDRKALRALLINLTENSLDACRVDKKKDEHAVTVSLGGDDASVVIEVNDTGIGMDQETREKAFSLFFSSKGAEGTGLGLFIANNIAQNHGGHIEVESELGKGSRFVVKIPGGTTIALRERYTKRGLPMVEEKKTILVVDDEPDIRDFLTTLLQDNGYETVTAGNGEEALDRVKEKTPHLVTLDITMPETSGVRFYRTMKESEEWKAVPIIIVTGIDGEFKKFISSRKQVPPPEGYVSKPIVEKEILALVEKLTN